MRQTDSPRREQSAVLRRMAYWGAREGPEAFLRLSPKPIGAAFGLMLPDVRRQVIQNLRKIHGKRSALREHLDAMATLGNYAACFAEAMAIGRDRAPPKVEILGEEPLHSALGRGGVVIVTAHVGPWDFTAQLLRGAVESDVIIVMEPEQNVAARELQDRLRGERGVRVLHVGAHPTDALPLVAHLRKGGVAALQLDRVPPSGRVFPVELFGRPFAVPQGPFRLAALSGAPVVPVFARRNGFFDYSLTISAPITLGRRAGEQELRAGAQQAAAAMESFVGKNPTQWFHFVTDASPAGSAEPSFGIPPEGRSRGPAGSDGL